MAVKRITTSTSTVNPLNVGTSITGPQIGDVIPNTQGTEATIKKESTTYETTDFEGNKATKAYSGLSSAQKAAVSSVKAPGIVSGGKTDIERKYTKVDASIGTRPQMEKGNLLAMAGSGFGTLGFMAASGARAAGTGATSAAAGVALGEAAVGGLSLLLVSAIDWQRGSDRRTREYAAALSEYNKKKAENSTVAGKWTTDSDGRHILMPDYDVLGSGVNVSESGSAVRELFEARNQTDTEVYFDDSGVLHISTNPAFAGTDEYSDILASISDNYSGLTRDTEGVDDYLDGIKSYVEGRANQWKFSMEHLATYKGSLPNASEQAILDASSNELVAYMSEDNLGDYSINLYYDGEIVSRNAESYLNSILDLDKDERNMYMGEIEAKLSDDSISDDDKAYILSEKRLLVEMSMKDGKYHDMLERSAASTYRNMGMVLRACDTALDSIASFIYGKDVDVFIKKHEYLMDDEKVYAVASFTTAFADAIINQAAMRGIEDMVVRPALGGVVEKAAEILGKTAKAGGALEKVASAISGASVEGGDVFLHLDAIKEASLNNFVSAASSNPGFINSVKMAAIGAAEFAGWSAGELAINFASDAIFDAAKLTTSVLDGDMEWGSDEAKEYFMGELGTDLAMDLLVQYGPQAWYDISTTLDRVRLERITPFRSDYDDKQLIVHDAEMALDEARASGKSVREIQELQTKLEDAKYEAEVSKVKFDEAVEKYGSSWSNKLGAELAGKLADMSEGEKIQAVQEKIFDEQYPAQYLAERVYQATGDVVKYQEIINKVNNNIRNLTRQVSNDITSDKYVSGTRAAFDEFKASYSDVANRFGALSKDDVRYIIATSEKTIRTGAAGGDATKIKEINSHFAQYIDGVDPVRQEQLNRLISSIGNLSDYVNKNGIATGVLSEAHVSEWRSIPGYGETGYIPLYKKRTNQSGDFTMQQTRRIEHTWKSETFWDIDSIENPVESVIVYMNNMARNIAVNERSKAIIEAVNTLGERNAGLHRTDIDTETYVSKDGVKYSRSDIDESVKSYIDKGIAAVEKLKTELPTETEFRDGQKKIVESGIDGIQKSIKQEGNVIEKIRSAEKRGELVLMHGSKTDTGLDELSPSKARYGGNNGVIFMSDISKNGGSALEYDPNYRFSTFSVGGKVSDFTADIEARHSLAEQLIGVNRMSDDEIRQMAPNKTISDIEIDSIRRQYSLDNWMISDLADKGIVGSINDPLGIIGKWQDENGVSVIKGYGQTGGSADIEYITGSDATFSKENAKLIGEGYGYRENETILDHIGDKSREAVSGVVDKLVKQYNDAYSKTGFTVVEVNREAVDRVASIARSGDGIDIADALNELASKEFTRPTSVNNSSEEILKIVDKIESGIEKTIDKKYRGLSDEQKTTIKERAANKFMEEALATGEQKAQLVAEELGKKMVGYKIDYIDDGDIKSAYIDGPMAKQIYNLCVKSENIRDRNFIQKAMAKVASLKRFTTTAIDPTRALPNLMRDTLRADIMSGGVDYLAPREMMADIFNLEGTSPETAAKVIDAMNRAARTSSGRTITAAQEGRNVEGLKEMYRESQLEGKNLATRVVWDLSRGDIGGVLETPMNAAEMFTRNRGADSAFVQEYTRAKYTTLSENERIERAYQAALNAGTENTTNFSRKGTMVGAISQYVPYFQQNFANIESAKISVLKDPVGVSIRTAVYMYAYTYMIADTLKKDETRKAYYNLSEYDRENNIVFSIDGRTLVTIPLDETLAAVTAPIRRTVETINGVYPETFIEIFTNSMLDLSPVDLSGFTEGDGINVGRGIEKAASQVMPSLLTEAYQIITGRNMYYGSDNAVTNASLRESGGYAETPSEYTTKGANSKILGKISNATGIPQWQLQQVVSNFGGNVGQYVLNTLDKLAGASEDEQGGKEFVDAVFKSMIGADSQNVRSEFYNGLNALKDEKRVVMHKLETLSEKRKASSFSEQFEIDQEIQAVKDEFAARVSGFCEAYLNAFEITGGLDKNQAMQIYYLFNLSEDESVATTSVGQYYKDAERGALNKEAVSWGADTLDKYYDQTRDTYYDESTGKWKYGQSYGEQKFFNTIYGRGEQYKIDLMNAIERKGDTLKSERSKAYDERSAAANAGDWKRYDEIALDYDAKVLMRIAPIIDRYGADAVLSNSSVMDYLEEWILVPNSYMKNKKGYNVSLAHNASKQRAFVRPYIRELYGLSTRADYNEIQKPSKEVK